LYQTILIPLDGSARAEAILVHALELARRFAARAVLLHVIEPTTPTTTRGGALMDVEAVNRRAAEAERYLVARQAEFEAQGLQNERLIEYGPVVQTICEAAERVDADLIAMASHGRTGLARVFYGSVAAGVLQRVDRPLLLVRSQQPDA
jgi:nucleotide-binding universal stress UspA family protein